MTGWKKPKKEDGKMKVLPVMLMKASEIQNGPWPDSLYPVMFKENKPVIVLNP